MRHAAAARARPRRLHRVEDLLVARCSGTGCRPAPRGSRRRSGRVAAAQQVVGGDEQARACRTRTARRRRRRTPAAPGAARRPPARPSTVTRRGPGPGRPRPGRRRRRSPSRYTVQEPHSPCSQAFFEPGQAHPLAQHVEQALALPDVVGLPRLAVDRAVVIRMAQPPATESVQAQARVRRAMHRERVPPVRRRCRGRRRSARRPPATRSPNSPTIASAARRGTPRPASASAPARNALGLAGAGSGVGAGRPDAGADRPRLADGGEAERGHRDHHRVAGADLAELLGARCGAGTQTAVISSSGARRRAASRRCRTRATGTAAHALGRTPARPPRPAASSGGCASPAGDAAPRLPPTVPRLRICGDPTVREAIASPGSSVAELVDDPRVGDPGAQPDLAVRAVPGRSSGTRVRSSSTGGRRRSKLSSTITSVPPMIGTASGCSARAARASPSDDGERNSISRHRPAAR